MGLDDHLRIGRLVVGPLEDNVFVVADAGGQAAVIDAADEPAGRSGCHRFNYSDFDQVMDSLETRIFTVPDVTNVYPGNGAFTTIGNERDSIPEWKARRW